MQEKEEDGDHNQPLKLELHYAMSFAYKLTYNFHEKPLHAGFDHRTLCVRSECSTTRPYARTYLFSLFLYTTKANLKHISLKLRPKIDILNYTEYSLDQWSRKFP